MDIILWRHAEAEDVNPKEGGDRARRLTAKGRGQAQQMAEWLKRHLPADIDIKASPARRCIETAEALDEPYESCLAVGPDCEVHDHLKVIEDARRAGRGALLLVGHQPTLGLLAATLITGESAPWSIKKGAVWWLHTDAPEKAAAELVAVLPPRLAGRSAA